MTYMFRIWKMVILLDFLNKETVTIEAADTKEKGSSKMRTYHLLSFYWKCD